MPPHDEVVDALFAPSADDVVALFELVEEVGDLLRIVLQIAIHRQDELALRMIEARGQRRGLSEIAPQLDYQHAAVYRGNLFQQLVGAITRSIVHQHQFKAVAHLFHHGLQAVIMTVTFSSSLWKGTTIEYFGIYLL